MMSKASVSRLRTRAVFQTLAIGLMAMSGCRPHEALKVGTLRVFPNQLELALQQLAIQTHLQFGLELQPSEASAGVSDSAASIDVSGLPATAAFAKVVEANGSYRWREVDGMILVRPIASTGVEWLDQRIDNFEVHDVTAKDAVYSVHRVFDPAYKSPPTASQVLDRYREQPEKFASVMKPVSVSLHQSAVWQVLDAIANAHGRLSWIVKYQGGKVAADRAIVELCSLDKWTIVTRARPIETRNAAASASHRRTSRRSVVLDGTRGAAPVIADADKH
jgi:hypothetical protein